MKRRNFIQRVGLGIGVLVMAPIKVMGMAFKKKEKVSHSDLETQKIISILDRKYGEREHPERLIKYFKVAEGRFVLGSYIEVPVGVNPFEVDISKNILCGRDNIERIHNLRKEEGVRISEYYLINEWENSFNCINPHYDYKKVYDDKMNSVKIFGDLCSVVAEAKKVIKNNKWHNSKMYIENLDTGELIPIDEVL